MGKTTITPFIYDGMLDFMLRVPYSHTSSLPYPYKLEYFNKKEFSFQHVLDRRLELCREFEKAGTRVPKLGVGKGRWVSADYLEQEEANGEYDMWKRRYP
tara:strand:+ start:1143 stop:1442 length:300 start_codon:yes stop_codon:yes gene_type:complete